MFWRAVVIAVNVLSLRSYAAVISGCGGMDSLVLLSSRILLRGLLKISFLK